MFDIVEAIPVYPVRVYQSRMEARYGSRYDYESITLPLVFRAVYQDTGFPMVHVPETVLHDMSRVFSRKVVFVRSANGTFRSIDGSLSVRGYSRMIDLVFFLNSELHNGVKIVPCLIPTESFSAPVVFLDNWLPLGMCIPRTVPDIKVYAVGNEFMRLHPLDVYRLLRKMHVEATDGTTVSLANGDLTLQSMDEPVCFSMKTNEDLSHIESVLVQEITHVTMNSYLEKVALQTFEPNAEHIRMCYSQIVGAVTYSKSTYSYAKLAGAIMVALGVQSWAEVNLEDETKVMLGLVVTLVAHRDLMVNLLTSTELRVSTRDAFKAADMGLYTRSSQSIVRGETSWYTELVLYIREGLFMEGVDGPRVKTFVSHVCGKLCQFMRKEVTGVDALYNAILILVDQRMTQSEDSVVEMLSMTPNFVRVLILKIPGMKRSIMNRVLQSETTEKSRYVDPNIKPEGPMLINIFRSKVPLTTITACKSIRHGDIVYNKGIVFETHAHLICFLNGLYRRLGVPFSSAKPYSFSIPYTKFRTFGATFLGLIPIPDVSSVTIPVALYRPFSDRSHEMDVVADMRDLSNEKLVIREGSKLTYTPVLDDPTPVAEYEDYEPYPHGCAHAYIYTTDSYRFAVCPKVCARVFVFLDVWKPVSVDINTEIHRYNKYIDREAVNLFHPSKMQVLDAGMGSGKTVNIQREIFCFVQRCWGLKESDVSDALDALGNMVRNPKTPTRQWQWPGLSRVKVNGHVYTFRGRLVITLLLHRRVLSTNMRKEYYDKLSAAIPGTEVELYLTHHRNITERTLFMREMLKKADDTQTRGPLIVVLSADYLAYNAKDMIRGSNVNTEFRRLLDTFSMRSNMLIIDEVGGGFCDHTVSGLFGEHINRDYTEFRQRLTNLFRNSIKVIVVEAMLQEHDIKYLLSITGTTRSQVRTVCAVPIVSNAKTIHYTLDQDTFAEKLKSATGSNTRIVLASNTKTFIQWAVTNSLPNPTAQDFVLTGSNSGATRNLELIENINGEINDANAFNLYYTSAIPSGVSASAVTRDVCVLAYLKSSRNSMRQQLQMIHRVRKIDHLFAYIDRDNSSIKGFSIYRDSGAKRFEPYFDAIYSIQYGHHLSETDYSFQTPFSAMKRIHCDCGPRCGEVGVDGCKVVPMAEHEGDEDCAGSSEISKATIRAIILRDLFDAPLSMLYMFTTSCTNPTKDVATGVESAGAIVKAAVNFSLKSVKEDAFLRYILCALMRETIIPETVLNIKAMASRFLDLVKGHDKGNTVKLVFGDREKKDVGHPIRWAFAVSDADLCKRVEATCNKEESVREKLDGVLIEYGLMCGDLRNGKLSIAASAVEMETVLYLMGKGLEARTRAGAPFDRHLATACVEHYEQTVHERASSRYNDINKVIEEHLKKDDRRQHDMVGPLKSMTERVDGLTDDEVGGKLMSDTTARVDNLPEPQTYHAFYARECARFADKVDEPWFDKTVQLQKGKRKFEHSNTLSKIVRLYRDCNQI